MPRELSKAERWFRRVIKLALLGLIVTLVIVWWPDDVLEVRTVPVLTGQVEAIVPSIQAGEVKSNRHVVLRPVAAGRIQAIEVERGDRVEAGQLLVELDAAALRARLRLARANWQAGQSALRTAEVRLETARKAFDRNRKLAARGAMAAGALERFEAEYDLAKEAVSTAQANVAQLKAGVDVAQTALAETRIEAPFAGLVAQVQAELGEVVSPANPLLELVDDAEVTVEAPIDEADLGRLKVGMPVRIETDAYPDQPFHGKLVYISPVVLKDLRQNRSLNVEVGLNGAADKFKVGMSADVEIVTDSRADVLWVPTAAVLRRGDRRQVYVAAGGRAKLRTVRCGLTNWDRTEILEGLREGERIIVSLDVEGLADGVRIRSLASAPKGTP